ncbi:Holliday junction branch migration protein RuvA [Candidatus Gracilibacteria bacterium]|nr:Holliday junction branch migration protein RuvA [Candidatus Gracilibacteria bacterium]
MISFLSGKIFDLESGKCNILTNCGIGYEVNINDLTHSKILLGDEIDLYIYHNITENNQSLYGFLDKQEKLLFTEFTKVSGVGGRSALNLLDLGSSNIFDALGREDTNFFSQAKGIGKKMAEKVILELKDKDFIKTKLINFNNESKEQELIFRDVDKQIKSSLVSMGYDSHKIDDILRELPNDIDDMGEILQYVIRNIR